MKRVIFEIKTNFKSGLIKRRKEFMEHLLRVLTEEGNPESEKELLKFGTRILFERNDGNSITINMDGETIYKD